MLNHRLGPCFLLTAFLLLPASSQQDTSATAKTAGKQSQKESAQIPPEFVENWKDLKDITSGLHPQAPVVVSRDEQPEFVRELIRLQWRLNDPIDLWVIRPKTWAKAPVVLYLYSYPSEGEQFRDNGWCVRTTAGGFAAVGFVSALTGPRYHARPMKEWFISELPESLGGSVHDVQLILNYLATRGDLDKDHVGMLGIGSGASIAILTAHADPRIQTIDVLDPWGDWPDWLRESPTVPETERVRYTTDEFLKSVSPFDPVVYLHSLKTRSVRLEQTLTDPFTPKSSSERIASSLRDAGELVRYSNPEEHMKAWQTTGLSGWIKQQLNAQMQSEHQDNHPPAANRASR